ncbi:endonuclease/exonuclease/phosphatase family metal-dependent hydrolase [Harryflintia acetispora]|uniref:Endonuclease/exonuclease/phosphatase family metal-dependent hydrolase n=2 Tax=Eubacteriales TaxID=186802 RepID=A0A9X8UJQ1_9FIRM|nr:endonuclease/exonuclease/phosphatase family metal-dependent hydrolase [Harryflintia acetispora]
MHSRCGSCPPVKNEVEVCVMSYSLAENDIIRVASFNLRRDFGPRRKYPWEVRRSIAADIIRDSGAAIIGVQEVLPQMRQDIRNLLTDYSIFGVGRMMGKKPKNDEHADIILKNDDVEVTWYKTFWLSKKPDTVSRAYFAMFPRICTVAVVKLKKSGRRIRVFNTHFDHVCWMARTLGVRMILDYINQTNLDDPLPTIVMGDFNAHPNSTAVKIIREQMHEYRNVHLKDVYGVLDSVFNTYHGSKGKIKPRSSPIDYIFVSDEFEVVDVNIDTQSRDGVYPSDHYPVMATLRFKDMA